jgi:hypothetical protein
MVACFIVFHFFLAEKKKEVSYEHPAVIFIRASPGIFVSLFRFSFTVCRQLDRTLRCSELPSHDSQCHQMVA